MSYTPTNWQNYASGGTLITASRLNKMELGIQAAAAAADAAQRSAAAAATAAAGVADSATAASNYAKTAQSYVQDALTAARAAEAAATEAQAYVVEVSTTDTAQALTAARAAEAAASAAAAESLVVGDTATLTPGAPATAHVRIEGATKYLDLGIPAGPAGKIDDASMTDLLSADTAARRAGDSRWLVGTTLVSPDNPRFAGNDAQRVQSAIAYAIANAFPSVAFTRMYDLTGAPPLSIDKTPWSDRRQLNLMGMGGGLVKNDAGAMFTSATANTGDMSTTSMKFQSVKGAGTIVWDCDKILRVSSSHCDYRAVDRVVTQKVQGRWVQSMRFSHDHIVGGAGPAMEWIECYDVTLLSNLFEDRDGALWGITPDSTRAANKGLRIIANVMENMSGTPLKLGSCYNTVIDANYFEANCATVYDGFDGTPAHIDLYVVQPGTFQTGVTISNNLLSLKAAQQAAKTVAVRLGRSNAGAPTMIRGNLGNGGTLFKFADYNAARAIADGSNWNETGEVFWPAHQAKVSGMHAESGTTAQRPPMPPVGHRFWDTSAGALMVAKATSSPPAHSLIVSGGPTAEGQVTITLNGIAYRITVAAGDTITQVRDKIVAAGAATFYPWKASPYQDNAVTFTSSKPGAISSSPTFSAGSTGVTVSYLGTTAAGTDPTWVTSGTWA